MHCNQKIVNVLFFQIIVNQSPSNSITLCPQLWSDKIIRSVIGCYTALGILLVGYRNISDNYKYSLNILILLFFIFVQSKCLRSPWAFQTEIVARHFIGSSEVRTLYAVQCIQRCSDSWWPLKYFYFIFDLLTFLPEGFHYDPEFLHNFPSNKQLNLTKLF